MATPAIHQRRFRRTVILSSLFVAVMLCLSFASVPLYRLFCQVTGFGGTTMRGDAAQLPAQQELARLGGKTVSIRFDGNTAPALPWKFEPVKTQESVRIGERRLGFYRATNLSDQPVTGTATYNVSPDTAGRYFVKIDCFCFTEQTLAPGETVDMPVTYYIDPAYLADPDAVKVEEITLSYTFYRSAPSVRKEEESVQRNTKSAGEAKRTASEGQG
jgi:cytochrome c oxidase assembly protein subunit 11